MNIGLAFWILMLIWFVFFLAWHFGAIGTYGPLGSSILLFILFLRDLSAAAAIWFLT